MSESKSESSPRSFQLNRRHAAVLGLVVVFVIALLVNFLVGRVNVRVDLTEYKTYTLSDGTRAILERLETPVEIRFYATDSASVMSPGERASVRRVEDLLRELVGAAPVKEVETVNERGDFETRRVRMLSVRKLNPEPNTDAEDAAILDGLQEGISGETNNELYFGIAIQCLDAVETIPFVPARPETLLEYELARAISSVHGGDEKKVVVMTDLPVAGGFGGNFQAPPQQPWMFYEQLSRDYEMDVIPANSTRIPEDTATLIVLHPSDITEEAQFAIDQYLLGGGNVLVFVDPNFFYSRAMASSQPQMPGMPPQGGPPPTSDLELLFNAWGVKYDANRVLADLDFGSEIIRRGNFSPTFLTLNRSALGSDPANDPGLTDPITRMLNQMNMLTPGGFDIDPPSGVQVDRLVLSSEMNQLVSSFDADPTQEGGADRIRERFEPHGARRALVARLSGEFQTAFPEGDPAARYEEEEEDDGEAEDTDGNGNGDSESADEAETADDVAEETESAEEAAEAAEEADEAETDGSGNGALKASVAPGRVVLVADVDFIYDANVVRRNQIPGLNIVIPEMLNENLTFVQNTVEQLSGDPDLINVRSRTSVRRPFTRQNEWYRAAQEKYATEVADFSARAKEVEERLNAILSQTPDDINQALLSPEVQAELRTLRDQEVEFRRRERELQKEVTAEFRRKLATYKFANSLGMPVLVILFGIVLAVVRRRRIAAR